MVKVYPFVFILELFLSVPWQGSTQELPVKQIPQIVVESNKKFFSDDQTIKTIDLNTASGEQHDDMGYVLERNSSALIRNYGGAGALTSISMNGTGANHTQVTWNGISLNSPSTGQADLSLIPSALVQSVEVIHGASGSIFGSGTFGGSVNLINIPDWNNRLALEYSLNTGSYGLLGHILSVKTGTPRFQYQFSAISSSSDNNFTYIDHYLNKAPVVKNKHNGFKELGLVQNIFINLNRGSYVEAGFWYQQKVLEIPALMGSYKPSFAKQKDSLFRSFISYRKTGTSYTLVLKTAYFSDFLHYSDKFGKTDSVFSVNSRIAASQLMNEADYRFFLSSKIIAGGGLTFNHLVGRSNNYGGVISENEYGIYGNLKIMLKAIIVNASLRKEFYDGLNPQPQYSLGVRYKPGKKIVLRSSFSSKFRKPTFNEKYWKPGGNDQLRPEMGRGGELTIEWDPTDKNNTRYWLNAQLTGYYQIVDNWIQWVFLDSLTPVEYKKVHARGLEAWLEYGIHSGSITFKGQVNYNLNRSTIAATFDDNAQYIGNQLVYIPLHTLRTSSEVKFRNYKLCFTTLYTGKRETVETSDEYLRLPAFMVTDISLGFQKVMHKMPVAMYVRVNNVFNVAYEIIRSYPVPGRTYQLTIAIGFNERSPGK